MIEPTVYILTEVTTEASGGCDKISADFQDIPMEPSLAQEHDWDLKIESPIDAAWEKVSTQHADASGDANFTVVVNWKVELKK